MNGKESVRVRAFIKAIEVYPGKAEAKRRNRKRTKERKGGNKKRDRKKWKGEWKGNGKGKRDRYWEMIVPV